MFFGLFQVSQDLKQIHFTISVFVHFTPAVKNSLVGRSVWKPDMLRISPPAPVHPKSVTPGPRHPALSSHSFGGLKGRPSFLHSAFSSGVIVETPLSHFWVLCVSCLVL
jgi:hypothetical protein